MNKLKKRWHDSDASTYSSLVSNLFDISKVKGLKKNNGRWDLRGVGLPEGLHLKNTVFEGVDFTSSDFHNSTWKECTFKDVIFDNVQARYNKFWACEFKDCRFQKSDLSYSLLNGALDSKSGAFINVTFITSNLLHTVYGFPIVSGCVFDGCKLDKVDFNGCRFETCKFIGKLNEVIFRGVPLVNKALFPSLLVERNRMINVDFRQSTLKSVMFIDEIELDQCFFPEGPNYIVIKNKRSLIFDKARKIIDSTWSGVNRTIGLALIDQYYMSERNKVLKYEVIDKKFLEETDKGFGEDFFTLLEKLNEG